MRKLVTVLCILAVTLPVTAAADPIQWSENGHWYELVIDDGVTWNEARVLAEDAGGYLATITSAEENDFIVSMFGIGPTPFWLGGFQEEGAPGADIGWQWVTGETWAYTNWAPGEPNDHALGNEDALSFAFWNESYYGRWNDAPAEWSYAKGGYIVEYNSVPEPGTLALLGAGLFAVGLARRIRKT